MEIKDVKSKGIKCIKRRINNPVIITARIRFNYKISIRARNPLLCQLRILLTLRSIR